MDSAGVHPELAAMLDGMTCRDYDVTAHVERCAYCRSELALYRSYDEVCELDEEDLAWIVERLAASDPWIAAPAPAVALLHGLERLFAACLLLVLSPALFLVCLITLLKARRWPLIRHERIGRRGMVIRMLKVRTMWPSRNDGGHRNASDEFPSLKTCRDPRVTSRFAAFCRRFSIDELPQLLHVATGEMSFVGPRPLTALELQRYYAREAAEVLSVRPGMAGLWQSMGRSRLTYAQRRRLDVFYVRHESVRLYFRTLIRTVPRALTGKDAW
jgi:exopolysaccharide production protein ExoY